MKRPLAIIVAIVVCLAAGRAWYVLALRPVDAGDDTRVTVQIPKGSSLGAVAELLEDKGLVRSARAFRWYAKRHGAEQDVKAGSFVLLPSMSAAELLDALRRGFSEEAIVTIPEGFTTKDIDALLADKGLIEPGALISCARDCDFSAFDFLPESTRLAARGGRVEGYLYPDTYFVIRDGFSPRMFLERLLSTFENRVIDGLAGDIKASGKNLHDIVTMASLVEEETRTDDERPVVAGILWKRLGAGQMLGVDAAVRYILDKPTAAITKADLAVDSPYNLRKVAGLPPGPIANPSLASIRAALHPQETTYWYYLHDANGRIHYARTNEEHNENRSKFLP